MSAHLSKAEIEAGTHFIAYVDVVKVVPGKPQATARDVFRVTVKESELDTVVSRAIQHLQTYRGDHDEHQA
jgi:hypothetical protein